MKILLTLTLFLVALVGCNSSSAPGVVAPEKIVIPKLASDHSAIDEKDYWITYPSSWRKEGASSDGTEFTLYAAENADDMFEDNLSLGIEALPSSSVTPEEYLTSAKTMIGEVIPDFTVLEESDVKNKYAACRKVEYTGNIQGLEAKWKQFVFIKNSKAYVLTFTCLNTPETIKKNDAASDKIMNSFILK